MTDATAPMPTADDPWGYLGRRCVVTGAASGIGKAACEILVSLGAVVVGVDVQPIEIDGIAAAHHLDLADPSSIDAVADAIDGSVDTLSNCAGIPGTADQRVIVA